MGQFLSDNLIQATALLLFGIGFLNLLLQKNLIKKIIGLNIMDTGVYLFLAAMGYIEGRVAAIVTEGQTIDPNHYINPIPAGLVLTGIVVSVSVSAVMLSMTVMLYRRYHTLNVDKICVQIRQKEK